MLVLSRKKGESIMIGTNVEIIVVGSEGDNIRIGIRAPRDVEVFRKEVYDSIQEANKEASESVLDKEKMKEMISKGILTNSMLSQHLKSNNDN